MDHGNIAASFSKRCSDEYGEPLVQPHLILPEQLCAEPSRHATPERRLMGAVLTDALSCFQRFLFADGARGRRLFREAECWLMGWEPRAGSVDADPYFSFEQVCEALALDVAWVRRNLRQWRERQHATGCPLIRSSPRREAAGAATRARSVRARAR